MTLQELVKKYGFGVTVRSTTCPSLSFKIISADPHDPTCYHIESCHIQSGVPKDSFAPEDFCLDAKEI